MCDQGVHKRGTIKGTSASFDLLCFCGIASKPKIYYNP